MSPSSGGLLLVAAPVPYRTRRLQRIVLLARLAGGWWKTSIVYFRDSRDARIARNEYDSSSERSSGGKGFTSENRHPNPQLEPLTIGKMRSAQMLLHKHTSGPPRGSAWDCIIPPRNQAQRSIRRRHNSTATKQTFATFCVVAICHRLGTFRAANAIPWDVIHPR